MGAFDDLVSGTSPTSGPDTSPGAFDDLISQPGPPEGRSFLGASAKAGMHWLAATGAGAISDVLYGDQYNPLLAGVPGPNKAPALLPSKSALLEIYKNDPQGFDAAWNSWQYAPARFAESQAHKAGQTLDEMSPEARKLAELEYATLDPSKAAYLSPTRVAGDILQSAPSNLATAGAMALTRGRASGTLAGGILEGGVEGLTQKMQVRDELSKYPLGAWENVPQFKQMVAAGWHPEMARRALIEQSSTSAAMQSGLFAGVAGALGGRLLGHFAEKGAPLLKRAGVGFLEELPTEAAQSAEQQIGQNVALRETVKPDQPVMEGVTEAAVSGGIVGGVFGALSNAAIGRRTRQAQQASEASAVPPVGEPWPTDTPEKADLKAKIANAALAEGVNPTSALVIAAAETGGTFNPGAVNPQGGASGLFQFMPDTARAYGVSIDELRRNPDLQIKLGIQYIKRSEQVLEKVLGRTPMPHEVYMAHLFGHEGVKYVLQADPDARILDIVSSYDPKNAAAVVALNGMTPDMTRDDVIAFWRNRTQRFLASARGGIPTAAEEDAARQARRLTDLDELDDLLEPKMPPPEAQVRAGEEEATRTARPGDDPEIAAALDRQAQTNQDVQELQDTQQAAELARRLQLPEDLQKATPRYGYGTKQFPLAFGDDLAKAAYIVGSATPNSRSAAHDRYVQWAADNYGMTEQELADQGRRLRQDLKAAAAQAKSGTRLTVPGLETQRADQGVSIDEARTRAETKNRNDRAPYATLPIAVGEARHAGKQLSQIAMKPGEVVFAAHPTEHFPLPWMQAVQQSVQSLVQQFVPTAKIILTGKTLAKDAVGYQESLGNHFYVINPRNLTRFEQTGLSNLNRTTQIKASYGLAHEVGHVIIDETFFEGMTPEVQRAIDNVKGESPIPEQVIAEVARTSPEKAAVLREYNTVKAALLQPGVSAQQFAQRWLSPWKLAHGLGQGDIRQGWLRFLDKFFLGQSAARASARDAALAMDRETGILGFHEYAAEQFARYAYNKQLLEKTAIGQSGWFRRTFELLRAAFKQAQLDKLVKPNSDFARWINELGMRPAPKGGRASAVPVEGMQSAERRFDPDSGFTHPDDPIVAETRSIIENRFTLPAKAQAEVEELLAHGQVEQAREAAEAHAQGPHIVRWDRDSPLYNRIDEQLGALDKLPGVRPSARGWLRTAYRRYFDFMLNFKNLREVAAGDPMNIALKALVDNATRMKERIGRLQSDSLRIEQRWAKLNSKQDKALQQLQTMEWQSGRHLPDLVLQDGRWIFAANERFAEAARAAGLDEQTAAVFLDVKNAYMYRLNRDHNVWRTDLERKRRAALAEGKTNSAAYYAKRIYDLAEAVRDARQRPFLPPSRFGNYLLQVRERNADGVWEVKHVEAFENPEARAEARRKLESRIPGLRMEELYHDSTVAMMRALPPEVHDEAGLAANLTPSQKRALRADLGELGRNAWTRIYSPQLAAITGHSRDGLRSFAEYMHHNSIVSTKMFFRTELKDALQSMKEDIAFANAAGDSDRVARLESTYRYATQAVQQILNPADEWHQLRAAVVFWQLGFNIKSAVMNLSSMIQTWAAITKRLGDIRGNTELGKAAGKILGDQLATFTQKVTGAPVRGWENAFSPDERVAMKRALEAGVLVETFGADLAAISQQTTLDRLSLPRFRTIPQRIMQFSTLPLRIVEEYTRRVTFLSMFNANRAVGMELLPAIERSIQDTLLLQGDNSIQMRAPILRGKKSAFLLYFNYMRGVTWAMNGGYAGARQAYERLEGVPKSRGFGNETARMWLAYLALGGLMGAPFAEDLDKVLELVAKQLFGSRFSLKEHAFELAGFIANNAAELGIDVSPRSIVHGMGSNFFGADVSGSISLGNAIPGLGGINKLDSDSGQVRVLTGLMGPLGAPLQAMLDQFNPSIPAERKFQTLLPVAMGNLVKGMESEPRYYNGGKVLIDPKTGQVKSLSTGEQVGQMMGFTPSAVRAAQEVHWMQQEFKSYWMERRNGLQRKLFEAILQGSTDARFDTMQEIARFNAEAPPGLQMSQAQIREGLQTRLRNVAKGEREVPNPPGLAPDYARVRRLVMGSGA